MAKKKIEDLDELETEESTAEEKPASPPKHNATVGRIVHYRAAADSPSFAAIVVAVGELNQVTITMFDPRGEQRTKMNVPYSDDGSVEGHWSWPPKV